ncbi:hypothetical protein [Bacillus phage YungSlug]|nr:hypothetical protein [Bacillus phage YungSlug]
MTNEEKLAKSLEAIENQADEVIAKSEAEAQAKAEAEAELSKGVKPDEVAEDNEGKEGEGEEGSETEDKDVKKSFAAEVEGNEELSKGIDASDFLAEFTRVNGAVIDGLRADVTKSLETSTHTATILAKSFGAIMKSQEGLTDLVKSQASQLEAQGELIKSLQDRLGVVEKTPTVRKSVVTPMEKSFKPGAPKATDTLSKSQIAEKLSDLAIQPNTGVSVTDVVNFESTGVLKPEHEALIKG